MLGTSSGCPIEEPVVQYGLFVMKYRPKEIERALKDFSNPAHSNRLNVRR